MGKTSELYIQIQDELFNQINLADEGVQSYLDVLIYVENERKKLEETIDIIKEFKYNKLQEISNESSDYKDGYKGFLIEVRNGRKMFNFKDINEWVEKQKELKEIEEKSKQAFISKEKGLLIASEYGEEIQLPKLTVGKSSIILKLKK